MARQRYGSKKPKIGKVDSKVEGGVPKPIRRRRVDVSNLPVIDDWPEKVPITEEELQIFERYFGDVLDRIFSNDTQR